jgi:FkbM family methyltransferase
MYVDQKTFNKLAQLVRSLEPDLVFTVLEVGARPISNEQEPFYNLLQLFPGSRILAFEVDEALCRELNEKCLVGVHYFPVALGRDNEKRLLYETIHPMCSSLYQPDELILRSYNNLDVSKLKSVRSIDTCTLDTFMEQHGISDADFIKIDVQGAELDVFKGGGKDATAGCLYRQ